jgi:hypothetical protein
LINGGLGFLHVVNSRGFTVDIYYLAAVLLLFAATVGLVAGCARLGGGR